MKKLEDEYRRNVDLYLLAKKKQVYRLKIYENEEFLIRFSIWIIENNISFKSLRLKHLHDFISTEIQPKAENKPRLLKFIDWLKKNGYPEINLNGIKREIVPNLAEIPRIQYRFDTTDAVLPDIAWEYLKTLTANRGAGTCYGYKLSLKMFYLHLDDCNVRSLGRVKRKHIESWLVSFRNYYAATTKTHIIFRVRSYLNWLYERQLLKRHPSELIKTSDLPKIPKYLPRPLTFEQDNELRSRLSDTKDVYCLGILLLRNTGIRIGDLINLDFFCLRESPSGGIFFLKTPLGKLKKEHLIPIDDETVNLIKMIQEKTRSFNPSPQKLIEDPLLSKASYFKFASKLDELTRHMTSEKPITLHRLRHTYATSMLNAGVSIVGVMNLLGHSDYRMTLRYAELTQKTVTEEYFRAMENIKKELHTIIAPPNNSKFNPIEKLFEIKAWLKNQNQMLPKLRAKCLKRVETLLKELSNSQI